MPAGGGCEEVRAIAPAPPPVRHDACSQPSQASRLTGSPARIGEGAKNAGYASERPKMPGRMAQRPIAGRNVTPHDIRRDGFDPRDFTPSPIRRGSRDGAAPAMAASRGRDVPVGVTASSECRGCLRVVVAKKCVPSLLHPLRCVTMLARSHRKHRASPAPPRGREGARALSRFKKPTLGTRSIFEVS